MEPEPDPIDLGTLDPTRNADRWNAAIVDVAARGLALWKMRRAVVRRGVAAIVLATAACLVMWLGAPRREQTRTVAPTILEWALRDVGPGEVLALGGPDAQ
jgi:predicted cobalt transporter CbtA